MSDDFSRHNILVCVTKYTWSEHELISSTAELKDPTGIVLASIQPCVIAAYKDKLEDGCVLWLKNLRISFQLPRHRLGYHFDFEICFLMNFNASHVAKLYSKRKLVNIYQPVLHGTSLFADALAKVHSRQKKEHQQKKTTELEPESRKRKSTVQVDHRVFDITSPTQEASASQVPPQSKTRHSGDLVRKKTEGYESEKDSASPQELFVISPLTYPREKESSKMLRRTSKKSSKKSPDSLKQGTKKKDPVGTDKDKKSKKQARKNLTQQSSSDDDFM